MSNEKGKYVHNKKKSFPYQHKKKKNKQIAVYMLDTFASLIHADQ